MKFIDMIRRVQRDWDDHPVCVFKMGEEFGVAAPNTADCVELELTTGVEFLGTYRKTCKGQKAVVAISRDL